MTLWVREEISKLFMEMSKCNFYYMFFKDHELNQNIGFIIFQYRHNFLLNKIPFYLWFKYWKWISDSYDFESIAHDSVGGKNPHKPTRTKKSKRSSYRCFHACNSTKFYFIPTFLCSTNPLTILRKTS